MPRGGETQDGEGVGQTPPCKPTFVRGFSLFNYSYRLPPLSRRGEGGFVLCRVPHTTTPLVNMCSRGVFQIIQQVIVQPQSLHPEGRGNLYFTPPVFVKINILALNMTKKQLSLSVINKPYIIHQ